jgi:hypothetical protein
VHLGGNPQFQGFTSSSMTTVEKPTPSELLGKHKVRSPVDVVGMAVCSLSSILMSLDDTPHRFEQ